MANIKSASKGARISRPNWQGIIIGFTLGFTPVLAAAETDAEALLRLHNEFRQQNGVAPLCANAKLMTAAQNYCQQMASTGRFSHTGADGSTPESRMRAAGYNYSWSGENIAAGQPTAEYVMRDWENSSGHRQNILRPQFKEAGFAHCGANYWVVDFASPASGQTNCTSSAGTTNTTTSSNGTTSTNTTTSTTSNPGLALYNSCRTYTTDWHYNATRNRSYIWYSNNCFEWNWSTNRMYVLILNTNNQLLRYPVQ